MAAPTKGNACDGLINKDSTAGMEKINGGEDGEEVSGSSVLNDPNRANMAVIEAPKKK